MNDAAPLRHDADPRREQQADESIFCVTSPDPLAVGLAIVVVLGAAMAARFVPARKAAGVDPMISLRLE